MTAALRPFRWLRAHPFVADALLGIVLCGLTLPGLWIMPDEVDAAYEEADALAVTLVLLSTLPLAWRRRAPLACLLVVGVAAVTSAVLEYPHRIGGLTVVIALYSVAAHADRRDSVVAAAFTALGATVAIASSPFELSIADFAANYLIFGTAWILGDNLRNRRARMAALEERAVTLERARDEEARSAVVAERNRIARELHDVVAHNMSVMVIQAGAARRVIDRDPAGAAAALASIEEVGRQALHDMRRSLGVLRDDGAEPSGTAPQPTVDDIERLVATTSDAGLDVVLSVEGEPRPLPPGIGLSAYRIVQEALTNALRHAGPASAEVRVRYGPDDLVLEVCDDGRGAASALTGERTGAGQGIVGMRERVQLFGGELRVGHRVGGGFGVWARLPVRDGR